MAVETIPSWGMDVLLLLGITAGAYLVGKLIVKPLTAWSLNRRSKTLGQTVSRLALYLTVVIGFGIGLTAGGYGNVVTAFGTIIAAGTVAIGFAMQDTIGAAVAGLFLLIDRPFEVGDWIEWGGNKGKVKEIRIRTTTVKTFDNELLTVPNNELANTTVKNPVAESRLRVQIGFGIGYEDDIEEAKQIITEILEEEQSIASTPSPDVKLVGLGDSTVDLTARYWINDPKRADFVSTRENVLKQVKQRFDEEGIDMPYPTQTIAGDSIRLEEQ